MAVFPFPDLKPFLSSDLEMSKDMSVCCRIWSCEMSRGLLGLGSSFSESLSASSSGMGEERIFVILSVIY